MDSQKENYAIHQNHQARLDYIKVFDLSDESLIVSILQQETDSTLLNALFERLLSIDSLQALLKRCIQSDQTSADRRMIEKSIGQFFITYFNRISVGAITDIIPLLSQDTVLLLVNQAQHRELAMAGLIDLYDQAVLVQVIYRNTWSNLKDLTLKRINRLDLLEMMAENLANKETPAFLAKLDNAIFQARNNLDQANQFVEKLNNLHPHSLQEAELADQQMNLLEREAKSLTESSVSTGKSAGEALKILKKQIAIFINQAPKSLKQETVEINDAPMEHKFASSETQIPSIVLKEIESKSSEKSMMLETSSYQAENDLPAEEVSPILPEVKKESQENRETLLKELQDLCLFIEKVDTISEIESLKKSARNCDLALQSIQKRWQLCDAISLEDQAEFNQFSREARMLIRSLTGQANYHEKTQEILTFFHHFHIVNTKESFKSLVQIERDSLEIFHFLKQQHHNKIKKNPLYEEFLNQEQVLQKLAEAIVQKQKRLYDHLLSRLFEIGAQIHHGNFLRSKKRLAKVMERTDLLMQDQSVSVLERAKNLNENLVHYQKWHLSVVYPLQEKICKNMEDLLDDTKVDKYLLDKIKHLNAEWKHVSQGLDRQIYWKRFHEAMQKAYEHHKSYMDSLGGLRLENIQKRLNLIEQVKIFVQELDQKNPVVIRELMNSRREFWKQWLDTRPFDIKLDGDNKSIFKKSMRQLDDFIDLNQKSNRKRKMELIVKARILLDKDFTPVLLKEYRQIKEEWKIIGTCGAVEKKLWIEFSDICRALFEKNKPANKRESVGSMSANYPKVSSSILIAKKTKTLQLLEMLKTSLMVQDWNNRNVVISAINEMMTQGVSAKTGMAVEIRLQAIMEEKALNMRDDKAWIKPVFFIYLILGIELPETLVTNKSNMLSEARVEVLQQFFSQNLMENNAQKWKLAHSLFLKLIQAFGWVEETQPYCLLAIEALSRFIEQHDDALTI